MKKLFIIIISLLLIVGLSSIVIVNAQDNKEVKKESVQNQDRGRNFVDNDKDGICDNNKMGVGRKTGRMNNGKGRYFVDKNNDGQCDNYPEGRKNNRSQGVGPNFVDKNNDGVCDNRPNRIRKADAKRNGNCDGTHKGWRRGR